MSDEKVQLDFENEYKSCFARSMVVNSQYCTLPNKPQEFFGKQPLKMTVERGSERDGKQGISQEMQSEQKCIFSNVSSTLYFCKFIYW